jgi:tRNA (guanine37-N1)-methyltransferase
MTAPLFQAHVLTLFPDMFPGPLGVSLTGKALSEGIWSLAAHDIRAHAHDKHRSVDDTPTGGGPGMVMRPDVLAAALDATAAGSTVPRVYLSPRGRRFDQAMAKSWAAAGGAVIVCGTARSRRSPRNWASATCWKAACSAWEVACASMPS